MQIRKVTVTDAPNFLRLLKKVDQSGMMLYDPGERISSVEEQVKVLEYIQQQEESMFFVAEEAGELVGYIGIIGNNLKRVRHIGKIVIGVLEETRGQGIATELFDAAFKWAMERGLSRIELTVIKQNNQAHQLYKKMGFISEGEKVHALFIDGQYVNELYLYKLI